MAYEFPAPPRTPMPTSGGDFWGATMKGLNEGIHNTISSINEKNLEKTKQAQLLGMQLLKQNEEYGDPGITSIATRLMSTESKDRKGAFADLAKLQKQAATHLSTPDTLESLIGQPPPGQSPGGQPPAGMDQPDGIQSPPGIDGPSALAGPSPLPPPPGPQMPQAPQLSQGMPPGPGGPPAAPASAPGSAQMPPGNMVAGGQASPPPTSLIPPAGPSGPGAPAAAPPPPPSMGQGASPAPPPAPGPGAGAAAPGAGPAAGPPMSGPGPAPVPGAPPPAPSAMDAPPQPEPESLEHYTAMLDQMDHDRNVKIKAGIADMMEQKRQQLLDSGAFGDPNDPFFGVKRLKLQKELLVEEQKAQAKFENDIKQDSVTGRTAIATAKMMGLVGPEAVAYAKKILGYALPAQRAISAGEARDRAFLLSQKRMDQLAKSGDKRDQRAAAMFSLVEKRALGQLSDMEAARLEKDPEFKNAQQLQAQVVAQEKWANTELANIEKGAAMGNIDPSMVEDLKAGITQKKDSAISMASKLFGFPDLSDAAAKIQETQGQLQLLDPTKPKILGGPKQKPRTPTTPGTAPTHAVELP